MPPVPSWMETLLTKFTQGDILGFTWSLYSQYFGEQIFLSILIATISVSFYLRAGLIAVSGFLLLTGGVMAALLPPEFHTLASILIMLGIASGIYDLIRGS